MSELSKEIRANNKCGFYSRNTVVSETVLTGWATRAESLERDLAATKRDLASTRAALDKSVATCGDLLNERDAARREAGELREALASAKNCRDLAMRLAREARERLRVAVGELEAAHRKQDPWSAYPPPQGESWHNPDGLTPEQVGVKEGWRLATKREVAALRGDKFRCWQPLWQNWGGEPRSLAPRFTYRTRAPLPKPSSLADKDRGDGTGPVRCDNCGGLGSALEPPLSALDGRAGPCPKCGGKGVYLGRPKPEPFELPHSEDTIMSGLHPHVIENDAAIRDRIRAIEARPNGGGK